MPACLIKIKPLHPPLKSSHSGCEIWGLSNHQEEWLSGETSSLLTLRGGSREEGAFGCLDNEVLDFCGGRCRGHLGFGAPGCALHTRLARVPESHSLTEACRHLAPCTPKALVPQESARASRKEFEAAVREEVSDQGPAPWMLPLRAIPGGNRPTLAAVTFPWLGDCHVCWSD